MITLDRQRRLFAAALGALAGYVDATGYLSADRYFVSFMSGNTTRFATDAIVAPSRAIIPVLLIGGFVLGVAAGGVTAHRAGRWRKPAVLGLVTLLLGMASGLGLAGQTGAMMMALVLAMGALNTAVYGQGNPVALTYLTGALVRMGQWLADRITRRDGPSAGPYLLLWSALAGGAALGALVFTHIGAASLLASTALAAGLMLLGWRIARISPQS